MPIGRWVVTSGPQVPWRRPSDSLSGCSGCSGGGSNSSGRASLHKLPTHPRTGLCQPLPAHIPNLFVEIALRSFLTELGNGFCAVHAARCSRLRYTSCRCRLQGSSIATAATANRRQGAALAGVHRRAAPTASQLSRSRPSLLRRLRVKRRQRSSGSGGGGGRLEGRRRAADGKRGEGTAVGVVAQRGASPRACH